MSADAIPDDLRAFIARHVHSVEQLEILCLLAENPAQVWSEKEVFKLIQSSEKSVAANLRRFLEERLLVFVSETGYRFSPETPELARLAVALAKSYRERRVTIIETIYSLPLDPVRQFADAFRLRKGKQ